LDLVLAFIEKLVCVLYCTVPIIEVTHPINNSHIPTWKAKYLPDPYALIFAVRQDIADPDPRNLYTNLRIDFAKTLDRIGKGSREDNKRRRKITLHSFRRFVKSTISDLGFGDYSEDFIGHDGSTYYRKTVKEKAEIFTKIEPYLTFLDFATLERKGSDTNTRIEELETTNQMLRQKDSMNADAIASLSDKMQELVLKVQELEKLRH
jgi:hypothetical protein